jgi:hexosaminidase
VGGDEAPKRRWQESELAQEVMRREGLTSEAELQSYFIRRIETFLLAHGRRLIGWDEILEGGLAPQAIVMSWRGTAGGIEAARHGHDVIMTPTSHVYLDYYQGDPRFEPLAIGGYTPLEKVYEFEPLPDELTPEEARHILGAQGNVWTEYMKTPEYVEYMALPRLLALAEVVWSPREARDWVRFSSDLPAQLRRLDALGVNYRIPTVTGLESDRLTLDGRVTVALQALIADAQIRYTTDGSDPSERSALYTQPLRLKVDRKGTVVSARVFLPNGRASASRAARFTRTQLRRAERLREEQLAPGLEFAYYEGDFSSVAELEGRSPSRTGIAEAAAIQGYERPEAFGLVLRGYIRAPADGIYTFNLTSDDGSRLLIGNEVVVDHDGYHAASEKSGMIALRAGYHPLTLLFFQATGGMALSLSWQREGADERSEVRGALFHRRD